MIEHVELRGSRTGQDATDRRSTARLSYCVWGSTSLDAIRDYMEPYVPTFYDGLVYDSVDWDHQGGGVWEWNANYKHPDRSDEDQRQQLETGEYVFSFDTSGGTVRRTVSLATTKYAKTGETAPDFKGLIGVSKEGGEFKVEGVEIGVQALKFSIHKRVPRTSLTTAYVKLLSDMTYTWNVAAYMGFEAGELLFVGASGSQGTNSDPEVTYNMIASPNVENLTIGDITVTSKRGHDYLWCYCEQIEDTSAKATVPQPKAAYVEQVYYSSAFALLGI